MTLSRVPGPWSAVHAFSSVTPGRMICFFPLAPVWSPGQDIVTHTCSVNGWHEWNGLRVFQAGFHSSFFSGLPATCCIPRHPSVTAGSRFNMLLATSWRPGQAFRSPGDPWTNSTSFGQVVRHCVTSVWPPDFRSFPLSVLSMRHRAAQVLCNSGPCSRLSQIS